MQRVVARMAGEAELAERGPRCRLGLLVGGIVLLRSVRSPSVSLRDSGCLSLGESRWRWKVGVEGEAGDSTHTSRGHGRKEFNSNLYLAARE